MNQDRKAGLAGRAVPFVLVAALVGTCFAQAPEGNRVVLSLDPYLEVSVPDSNTFSATNTSSPKSESTGAAPILAGVVLSAMGMGMALWPKGFRSFSWASQEARGWRPIEDNPMQSLGFYRVCGLLLALFGIIMLGVAAL
jgi:hypothetical protein